MPLPNAPDYSQRIYELLKETDLENLSYAQFQAVAEKIFIEPENEDEMRRLVLVQLARMAVRGDWDGFLTGGGGGGGAPTNAEYVVMSLNGTLTNERVLTAGTGISLTDGGAGSNATIANTGVTSLVAGTNITLSPVSGVGDVTVTAATPTGLAPNDASYLTLGLDGDLTNERVLTAGSGISFTDTGPNGTLTIETTGGGGGGINPLSFSTSQGLGTTAYWLLGLNPAVSSAFDIESYTTSQSGFMMKFQPPFTGTSGIYFYTSVASASANNYLWIYEESSTGYAGTFVAKILLPTSSTGGQSVTQWLDAAGSNISSPTFSQGETYIAVLEIGSQFTASSGRQNNLPFVNIATVQQFATPSTENFNMQYTGTIDSSLSDSEINFFSSAYGWPMLGLSL